MRIILALFIYIYAFGVDVCERRDIEMSAYIEKHAAFKIENIKRLLDDKK
ncbi:TPA: hypothetical protein RTB26_000286 [Campylobacter jejuni]|nr:hypothetical protein [Campylobacter sp. BCW_6871]HDZ4263982.1 hypothetical protein [Campylobacter jejuni]HEB9274589.1 hypothetical protein [Campylobacter jejuni]HED4575845.1 hypothetical protein [Campylobacter jejuni]HEF7044534.1 hypothetical protein [Campylobacter jejuni]HEF7069445.1 hypothetical protein [Campylobacter jejuni]